MGNCDRLVFKNVNFGYENLIFKDFSVDFPMDRVSVVLGGSGCGKTSLLRLICGLNKPDSGEIFFGAETREKPKFGFIFQEPRLLPWRSIRKNIEIILEREFSLEDRKKIAERYLRLVGLEKVADSFPGSLSGGMKQRVSIARAFAFPSDVILMDEPFQGLDLKIKMNLIELFIDLREADKRTAVLVTHDVNEAFLLADELFVLSNSHPTGIIFKKRIDQAQNERRIGSDYFVKIQSELYSCIFQ